jgi:hypothetical protein
MVYKTAVILLVVALGMCVVAFPFVLWMLFGNGPRSRPMRYISRPRENGTTDLSGWSEDRKKKPRQGTTGLESEATSKLERVTKIILALNVRRL